MSAQSNKGCPAGYHSITPSLIVRNAADTIDFYKAAFNAKELHRMNCPETSKVMHSELQIGDSRIMVADENPGQGCSAPSSLGGACSLYLYVEDADATFEQAVQAGGKAIMGVQDMFWGDRMGTIVDPSGHRWSIATHKLDLTPEEINERAEAFFAAHAGSK